MLQNELSFLEGWTGNLYLSIFIMVCIGITSGSIAAYLGLGGGFILTPVFHGLLRLPAIEAIATSMAHIPVLMTVAAIKYRKKINFSYAGIILIAAIPASQITAFLWNLFNETETGKMPVLSGSTLSDLITSGLFIILSAVLVINSIHSPKRKTSHINVKKTLLVSGAIMGSLSALLGIGGGFIIVPVLITLIAMEPLEATATSIFTILPVSLITSFYYISQDKVHIFLALLAAAGGIIGVQIGSRFALASNRESLKKNIRIFHGILIVFYLTMRIFI